ncbi:MULTISPECIES: hypothetical protein [unclassified Sphingobacterium]|uniref:hypothetical protein n=1 Tax=unclassified Sphingobacterium TaxID=2609468 RepID=UPI0025E22B3E|nr:MULTISPECIES: hypothetical protein [unclassified Sphingobacterium]
MNQSEKLDTLLKVLYEFPYNNQYYDFSEIAGSAKLSLTSEELTRLFKRLRDDSFIEAKFFLGGYGFARITSYGIDFVEGDSYKRNESLITTNNYHTTVTNSSGISVVNASSGVNVNISNIENVNSKIEELTKLIQASPKVPEKSKADMIECIDEIKRSLVRKEKPKFAFQALLGMVNNFAGIASLVVEIGKLIFGNNG